VGQLLTWNGKEIRHPKSNTKHEINHPKERDPNAISRTKNAPIKKNMGTGPNFGFRHSSFPQNWSFIRNQRQSSKRRMTT
jgi:hypothetical protein